MSRRNFDRKQMISDIRDHPVKAYFKYPLGLGWNDIRFSELGLGLIEVFQSCADLLLVILLLLWQRIIRNGLLRPFYKAWCVYRNRRRILQDETEGW